MTRQQYNSMYGGGKKKGGGGVGLLMGILGGGGSAAVNPEIANLAKYGELGNVAGDADLTQFVPSGRDIMGQSSSMADELNNRMYMSQVMAKYNDSLARGLLPLQTDEAIRQGQTLDKSRAALKQTETENAKQVKGEDYYRGLESLTDQERQMMFPNNPEVMWEDFGKLAGRIDSTYPQISQEGLRGILAKLPEQRAGFKFDTSPEGQQALATNAEILANKPLLDARRSSRFSVGDTIFEPGNPLIPSEGGTEMRAGSNRVINRNMPIPQTEMQRKLGAPQEYMREQELIPTAPSYGVKGSFAPVTIDDINEVSGFDTNQDSDYNQTIRAQPTQIQQPTGISGTPTGDKSPPSVVISAQPQAQYEGLLPQLAADIPNSIKALGNVGDQVWNDTANNMNSLLPSQNSVAPIIDTIKNKTEAIANSDLRKHLIRAKGESVAPLNNDPLSAYINLLRNTLQGGGDIASSIIQAGADPVAEILQGLGSYINPKLNSDNEPLPISANRPKKFPKSMKTKLTPYGLNTQLRGY